MDLDAYVMQTSLGASNNSKQTGLMDFPGENPAKPELRPFLDVWDKYAAAQGYMPFLNGQDPPSFVKFRERDLTAIPEIQLASLTGPTSLPSSSAKRFERSTSSRTRSKT